MDGNTVVTTDLVLQDLEQFLQQVFPPFMVRVRPLGWEHFLVELYDDMTSNITITELEVPWRDGVTVGWVVWELENKMDGTC